MQVLEPIIIVRAQAGDREAIEQVARHALRTALRVAASITGSRAAAEDIAQDTVVRALRTLERLRDPARLDGWIARTATTESLQHLRRPHTRRESSTPDHEPVVAADLRTPRSTASPRRPSCATRSAVAPARFAPCSLAAAPTCAPTPRSRPCAPRPLLEGSDPDAERHRRAPLLRRHRARAARRARRARRRHRARQPATAGPRATTLALVVVAAVTLALAATALSAVGLGVVQLGDPSLELVVGNPATTGGLPVIVTAPEATVPYCESPGREVEAGATGGDPVAMQACVGAGGAIAVYPGANACAAHDRPAAAPYSPPDVEAITLATRLRTWAVALPDGCAANVAEAETQLGMQDEGWRIGVSPAGSPSHASRERCIIPTVFEARRIVYLG
ncbi:MAG TPA: sigma-70 family RNA polymerase sigma factor [Gaiellales bacterium]